MTMLLPLLAFVFGSLLVTAVTYALTTRSAGLNARLRDVNGRELATSLPFVVMVLVMGVLPGFFLDRLETSTRRYVARAQVGLDVQQRDEDTRVTVLPLSSPTPVAALPAGTSDQR